MGELKELTDLVLVIDKKVTHLGVSIHGTDGAIGLVQRFEAVEAHIKESPKPEELNGFKKFLNDYGTFVKDSKRFVVFTIRIILYGSVLGFGGYVAEAYTGILSRIIH